MTETQHTDWRKLKIAIFHFGFFYSGGGEKLVLEEVKGLRSMGHDVTCYAAYVDRERCFPDWDEIKQVQTLLPPPPAWVPLNHALWVLACCLLIPFMAPRFKDFDVLLGANQPAPWYAFVLSKLLRKPYGIYLAQPLRLLHPRDVDRENGLRIHDGDQRFVRFLTRFAAALINWADRVSVRSANVVLTNGNHVSKWIRAIYDVESVVCPAGCHPVNSIESDWSPRLSGSVEIGGAEISKPYVLLTNRHSPMKRFEYALWALKSIARDIPNTSLVITGQPTEYTNQLRYLANGLLISDRVKFVGLVEEQELARLYSEASLYLYTSPEEDFGMGVIEAMAHGAPVVAWNRAGPTGTVQNNITGFLVQPYDTELLAEKMKVILSNPELASQMGKAGHRRAKELFSYDHHNRILEWTLLTAEHHEATTMTEAAIPAMARWNRE